MGTDHPPHLVRARQFRSVGNVEDHLTMLCLVEISAWGLHTFGMEAGKAKTHLEKHGIAQQSPHAEECIPRSVRGNYGDRWP
jgi:hypothetical protein